jgi:hypothetical protein
MFVHYLYIDHARLNSYYDQSDVRAVLINSRSLFSNYRCWALRPRFLKKKGSAKQIA